MVNSQFMSANKKAFEKEIALVSAFAAVLAALFAGWQGYLSKESADSAKNQLNLATAQRKDSLDQFRNQMAFSKKQAEDSAVYSKQTLDIANRNATASEATVRNQMSQLQLSERAWVGVDMARLRYVSQEMVGSTYIEHYKIEFDVRVTGGSPALQIHLTTACQMFNPDRLNPIPHPVSDKGSAEVQMALLPGNIQTFVCPIIREYPNNPGTPGDGTAIVRFSGQILYRDIFGHDRRTDFCFEDFFQKVDVSREQVLDHCFVGNSYE